MINSNDLRINNWVRLINAEGLVLGNFQISGFDKIDNTVLPIIQNGVKEIKINEKLIQGIPLTADILAGIDEAVFNPISRIAKIFNIDLGRGRTLCLSDIGTCNGFIFLSDKDENDITDSLITLYNWDYDKDIYLHELQNLYHSLSRGKELTINL